MRQNGELEERFHLLEKAYQSYPNNICLKYELMNEYYNLAQDDSNDNNYYSKTIELANELKEIEIFKYETIQILVLTHRQLGRGEEMLDIVDSLPSIWTCKNLLKPACLKNEERIKAVQEIFIDLIQVFNSYLLQTYGRAKVGERDIILLKQIDLINTIFENKDYGYFNLLIYDTYVKCAKDQAMIQNPLKTIEYLKLANKYAIDFDNYNHNKEIVKNTSFLVDRLIDDPSECIVGITKKYQDELKRIVQNKHFDFIRHHHEFIEMFN